MSRITIDLIQRLRSSPDGTLALDAEIAVAMFRTVSNDDDLIYAILPTKDDRCAGGTFWVKSRSGMSLHTAPAYSRSIDAAIDLLPEGWIWDVSSTGQAWAVPDMSREEHMLRDFAGDDRQVIARAATPALALCIVALKARTEGEG